VVVAAMRTVDGSWRVLIFDDQTAQLVDGLGRSVMGDRQPLYRIADRLAELGFAGEDLEPA
jgi:hypothetical protein